MSLWYLQIFQQIHEILSMISALAFQKRSNKKLTPVMKINWFIQVFWPQVKLDNYHINFFLILGPPRGAQRPLIIEVLLIFGSLHLFDTRLGVFIWKFTCQYIFLQKELFCCHLYSSQHQTRFQCLILWICDTMCNHT